MKIMVVDDSNVIRTMIENVLQNHTLDLEFVGSAKDGVEAVEQFQELRPQVMTLDITMPRMDGIETIEKIIEIDDNVQILVVSALADKKTLLEAISLGASGFLCKPFSENDLMDALEELLED